MKGPLAVWCAGLAAFTLVHVRLEMSGPRAGGRGAAQAGSGREELVVGHLPVT